MMFSETERRVTNKLKQEEEEEEGGGGGAGGGRREEWFGGVLSFCCVAGMLSRRPGLHPLAFNRMP